MSSTVEIKQILTKFIQHVNELEAKDERTTMTGFEQEFRELRMLGIKHKEEDTFPAEEGKKTYNIKKNRYKDIIPYDATRVKLSSIPNVSGSDYINANYIESASKGHGYIASQGPLPNTVGDFWRMIMELGIDTVVMACKEEESNKPKCERYWPKDGESKMFGSIEVKMECENKISSDFIIRNMTAKQNNEVREITQLHLAEWPDHGVPDVEDQTSILDAITMLSERTRKEIPVVIHCSAGCGRTGTICAIDYAQTLLKDGNITPDFSLFEIIKYMRTQRQSMVQTPDQYQLAHYVVRQVFRSHLKSLGHSAVYENVNIFENMNTSQNEICPEPEYADIAEVGKEPQPEDDDEDDVETESSSSSLIQKPDTLPTTSPRSSNATTPIRSPIEMKSPIKSPKKLPMKLHSPGHLPTSLPSLQSPVEHRPNISKSESLHTYHNIEINSDNSGSFVTRVRIDGTESNDDNKSQQTPAINLHRQSVPPARKKITPEYENVQINGNNVPELSGSKGATSSTAPIVHFSASHQEVKTAGREDKDTEALYTRVTKSHMRSYSEPENTVTEMSAMKSPASFDFGAQEADTPNLPPRKYKDEQEKSKEEKHTGKFGKMLGMFHIKNSSSSDKHSGKHQKITEIGFPQKVGQPKGPREPPHFFRK